MNPKDSSSGECLPERRTNSGIPLKISYGPRDIAHLDPDEDIGEPGQFPFLRGIYPTMYRGRLWTRRQYAGFGNAADTNHRFKFLLDHGQTGLSMAFDLPTQVGLDSDDPMAEPEVGRTGVAIDTLADMETVFEGIDIGKISTSFTINATASIILAMYLAVAEKQGVPPERISGTIQNDILKEYIARGTWIFPPEPSLRLLADTVEYCLDTLPRMNPISVAGAHIREAGATPVEEIAYTFCDAKVYIEELMARGRRIDTFAPKFSFVFDTLDNFFEEICKYRFARRLWARLIKEYGAQDPASMRFRFAAGGGGLWMMRDQAKNNIIRLTLVTLATVLGGAQSVLIAGYDEAHSIPSEDAARLSLMMQNIIAYESGVADTVDPLAGSYFVEALTDAMEQEARARMAEVDAQGGMVKAIESGFIQRKLAEQAAAEEARIRSGEKVVVGLNKFVSDEKDPAPAFVREEASAREQIESLRRARASRDAGAIERALTRVKKAAEGRDNLLPPILDAVKAYASLGEIVGALKEVFGEHREAAVYF